MLVCDPSVQEVCLCAGKKIIYFLIFTLIYHFHFENKVTSIKRSCAFFWGALGGSYISKFAS